MQEEQPVAILSLSECQINQQIVLDLETVSGDDFFTDVGTWLMQGIAHLHVQCAEKQVTPCVHFETLTMARPDFVTLVVEAYLDDIGICHTQ